MKWFRVLAVCLGGLTLASPAMAEKNSVQLGDVSLLSSSASVAGASGWRTLLSADLRTANASDAIVGVSLEAGLFTSTLVSSKRGTSDSSSAEALVEVRVLIDGEEASPGTVTFARRTQTLMAKFGGIVESCSDSNGDGTIVFDSECDITDEELELVLDTMAAHSFNFVLADLSSGVHTIEVQARVGTNTSWESGSARADAVIGKGSLVVEEVRLVRDLQIEL